MNQNKTPTNLVEPNPFYLSVLQRELSRGSITENDKILVVCGGNLDRSTLLAAGFHLVTISNLAPHGGHQDYSPFNWDHQDIEELDYADGEFDVAIVHSGLHHCYNPYRSIGEMCRVARKTVIAFEPYDTWLTRLGAKLGYGQLYEDQAVHGNGGESGGAANSEIPNYVYRFREPEVEKFACAYFPYGKPDIHFYRALRINEGRFRKLQSAWLRYSFLFTRSLIQGLAKFIPSMNNNFCFVLQKPAPSAYHPWVLEIEGHPRINKAYLERKYGLFPEH